MSYVYVTSTASSPAFPGGTSIISSPRDRLLDAKRLSPWSTFTRIFDWLSWAVYSLSVRLVGITVFRSIIGQKIPFSKNPFSHSRTTSVPRVKGQTSVKTTSLMASLRSFMAAWMAAPKATASSGLTFVSGRALNNFPTKRRITGLLVAPPTSTTLSMSDKRIWASERLRLTGWRIRPSSSLQASSYRESSTSRGNSSSPILQFMEETLPWEKPILQASACRWIWRRVFSSKVSRSN